MSPYNNKIQQAAALKFQPDLSQGAPVVVASGLGCAAQKIIECAEENNVPVYQDDSLAAILSQFYAGSEIPKELYQAIADIYIYFLHFNLEKSSADTEFKGSMVNQPVAEDKEQTK